MSTPLRSPSPPALNASPSSLPLSAENGAESDSIDSNERRDRKGSGPRLDRPRERLSRFGPEVLSEAELLALILRTGDRERDAAVLASQLIQEVGGLEGLAGTSIRGLAEFPGLGPAKAASICASIELGFRIRATPLALGQRIRSPVDVQRHFMGRAMQMRRESFHVLLLDGRHRLITSEVVSVGTLTASLVHPREVFRSAIREAAAAVVLVHNHPSGDPTPSGEDRAVTERLRSAGELIGIEVVDHVIVAAGGHFSFREAGGDWGPQPVGRGG